MNTGKGHIRKQAGSGLTLILALTSPLCIGFLENLGSKKTGLCIWGILLVNSPFLGSANQITLHWPARMLSKKDASLWLTNIWVSSEHGTVHTPVTHESGTCRAQIFYSWQHGEFAPVTPRTVQFCHYKKLNTAWPWPLASSMWHFLLFFYSKYWAPSLNLQSN